MGKRKSARKPVMKRKLKLDTLFNCLYCNHEQSVEVRMDNDKKLGFLRCRICDEKWQSKINALSEPVDVYSDWIDAAEAAQKQVERETRAAHEEDYDSQDEEQRHSIAPSDEDEGQFE